ncbi:hypothetical protein PR048_009919 [Dryococelus australis]|uniref:DDE-1 domain-containing protein n=1 Tax=Dryococelus australis TaxID=614101 RepID=A0ABQ9I199_9NEOP|nr:hypothetical protein PR048_009919 [Dryococelus australis]
MLRHPELSMRTPESLSYGRLMRFNKETVGRYFELLQETIVKMKLSGPPQLIYNVDATGIQLSYERKQKAYAATNAERGETVSALACVNATGTNWIPPFVIFKEYVDGLPPGSVFAMTEKGYMQTKEFCNWLHYFNNRRLPGNVFLILAGQ